MSGSGGIDHSIALQAGRGVEQPNPLRTIGEFANVQNALNQAKLFPETLAQQRQHTIGVQRSTAYGFLAPLMDRPPEQWTHKAITDLLGPAERQGVVTHPILADLALAPSADGAALANFMRPLIASQMQTSAPERLRTVTPGTQFLPVGDQTLPLSIAPSGSLTPGVPTQSAPGFGQGYTPGERMQVMTRKATQADVDANPGLQVGQDIPIPATEVVRPYSAPIGGARIPAGALGPGGYAAPTRPLDQLGSPYRPPGVPAAPAQTSPVAGARLMKGPGGTFWVTPDKVSVFQQNGYQ